MRALESLMLYKESMAIPTGGTINTATRRGVRNIGKAYRKGTRVQKEPSFSWGNVTKGVAIGSVPVGIAAAASQG